MHMRPRNVCVARFFSAKCRRRWPCLSFLRFLGRLRKVAFYVVKGCLSPSQTMPFWTQKVAFRKNAATFTDIHIKIF